MEKVKKTSSRYIPLETRHLDPRRLPILLEILIALKVIIEKFYEQAIQDSCFSHGESVKHS